MSTQVHPPISPSDLIKQEEASIARELEWLLTSLQETLASLKAGLEECLALLEPQEPGSTLVVSSSRSEAVKGFVTRVGTRIVKGDISLRLQTLPPPRNISQTPTYPLKLSNLPTAPPLIIGQLVTLRTLLNQSLDVVDSSIWTGNAHDASFISGQLRLLSDLLGEARGVLKGGEEVKGEWWMESVDEKTFNPPVPSNLSLYMSIQEASLLLTIRTLSSLPPPSSTPTSTFPFTADALSLRQRLGLAPMLPTHDETDKVFTYRGSEVRVREKVRVESADPSLMAALAKVSALQHGVGVARRKLEVVMSGGVKLDEE